MESHFQDIIMNKNKFKPVWRCYFLNGPLGYDENGAPVFHLDYENVSRFYRFITSFLGYLWVKLK